MSFDKEIWNHAYNLKVRILDNDISNSDELDMAFVNSMNSIYKKFENDEKVIGKKNINPDVDENVIYNFFNKIRSELETSLESQLSADIDITDLSEIDEFLGRIKQIDGEYSLPNYS